MHNPVRLGLLHHLPTWQNFASFDWLIGHHSLQEHSATAAGNRAARADGPASEAVADLHYRCLHGVAHVFKAVAAAAEEAGRLRHEQVTLSDRVAALLSDLASKLLEAEACVDEAAQLEGHMAGKGRGRAPTPGARAGAEEEQEQQGEQALKLKLMINALLQKVRDGGGGEGRVQVCMLVNRPDRCVHIRHCSAG